MARPKKASAVLHSIEECTQAMGELLAARLDLERLKTRRDTGVARLQARYEAPIMEAQRRESDLVLQLETYYYGHLAELEASGRKSVHLANGVMGRRDNPEKLMPLNKAWTWAKIVTALKVAYPGLYLRTRDPEPDKEAIRKDLGPAELKQVGLKLDQDETFFAEPARLPAQGD